MITGLAWKRITQNGITMTYSGYLLEDSFELLFKRISSVCQNQQDVSIEPLNKVVRELRGHFALIIRASTWEYGAVDKVRSIPVFCLNENGVFRVLSSIPELIKKPSSDDICDQAALEIAMSGYTIGGKSINRKLSLLSAGESLMVFNGNAQFSSYYQYKPWEVSERSESEYSDQMLDVGIAAIKDMTDRLDGRQILVPLSAGVDSRFIVSSLKYIGYKNVLCYSFGNSRDNFEVVIGKEISNRLNYDWKYIPMRLKDQREVYQQDEFKEYLDYSDTLSNSPIIFDYSAIKQLKQMSCIDSDAVVVNGNSGDYITGGHVPFNVETDSSIDDVIDITINKHYKLWPCLNEQANHTAIKNELHSYINHMGYDEIVRKGGAWAVIENMEWAGRQSKFVTCVQRNYEFHGFEWRLPLWDDSFMDFWHTVPSSLKLKQHLYKTTLYKKNISNVWSDIPVNPFGISSFKLRLLRNTLKLLVAPFGRSAWHNIDRRVFSYYLDNTASTAIVPYLDALFDKCGARNRNSWMARRYLEEKGIELF